MLEPVLGVNNIPKDRYALYCSLCKRSGGACLQCSFKRCTYSFHPLCGLKSGLLLPSDEFSCIGFCPKHLKLHASIIYIF